MSKIPMVDLRDQYLLYKDQIDNAIQDVLDSTQFIGGEQVQSFKESLAKYLDVKNVIPCANGTDALQLAMMALDLKPGDEVITASFTYVATAEVIALLGLKPVLIDVDEETFCLNVDQIESVITPNTKAIVPVHLFGHCAPMEEIMAIADKNNIFVIEDTAQALGAEYQFSNGKRQKAGTIGHIGCTSFFPSKNLGCYGDGGAVFTNDDRLAKKLQIMANHGQTKQYHHDYIGVNSRLDAIQAAILNVKLPHLDSFNAKRNEVARRYNHAFENMAEIKTPSTASYTNHVFHQYTLKLIDQDRDSLKNFISKKGVSSMIYYPIPLHRQIAYRNSFTKNQDLSISEKLSEIVLSLPISPNLSFEDQSTVIEAFQEYFQ